MTTLTARSSEGGKKTDINDKALAADSALVIRWVGTVLGHQSCADSRPHISVPEPTPPVSYWRTSFCACCGSRHATKRSRSTWTRCSATYGSHLPSMHSMLTPSVSQDEFPRNEALMHMPMLEAYINETLRVSRRLAARCPATDHASCSIAQLSRPVCQPTRGTSRRSRHRRPLHPRRSTSSDGGLRDAQEPRVVRPPGRVPSRAMASGGQV